MPGGIGELRVDHGRRFVKSSVLTLMLAAGGAWAQDTTPRTTPPRPNPAVARPTSRTQTTPQQAARAKEQGPTTQPGDKLAPAPEQGESAAQPDSDMVYLPAFAEPVQLSSLVELVARTLQINVAVQGDVPGTVVFNAPIPVKRSDLIGLLDRLLEQQGYTITQDEFGLYTVHPLTMLPSLVGAEQSTTRIIRTPNVRPSSLKSAIESQIGPPPPGGVQGRAYAYIDDLGVILATDSPRRLAAIERLVAGLLSEASNTRFTRIELKYLAASVARQRALELVGSAQQTTPGRPETVPGVAPAAGAAAVRPGSLDNLAERLTVDPQGNALIFRGRPEEVEQVQAVLAVIDVPNNLTPKNYAVGSWASSIANIARSRGLGEVTTIEEMPMDGGFAQNSAAIQRAAGGAGQQQMMGGPVMVVDSTRGSIIYYATDAQHKQMDALIREIDPQSERVIIGVYKLKNSDAEEVAAVIDGIIHNQRPYGTGDLLPDGGQPFGGIGRSSSRRAQQEFSNRRTNPLNPQGGQSGQDDLSLSGEGYVVADKANNQILVKAPAGQQQEFARLIEKLDLRRPQVYIEAKIIAVTWSDEMRLAFETQLINANGQGGVLNTNFGLSSFATGAAINTPKTVATGLAGLTAAIIKNDQVPIIINALQTKTDSRILSTPQLLVDDNEEATIVSVDSQPTAAITQGNATTETGFAGYEDAGTTLKVTPHISDAGYLGLKYEVELSNFTGSGTATLPPPKTKNNLQSNSITIPADTTVIVGGLNFQSNTLTRAQVPLLGDIPLLGLLFQDRRDNDRKTTLYVFLTPRILRDPTFADLRILTAGPQRESMLGSELPPLRSAVIDIDSYRPYGRPSVTDRPPPLPAPDEPEPELELIPLRETKGTEEE
jgi:type II secretory pathway component GspD/PulD (secretin)